MKNNLWSIIMVAIICMVIPYSCDANEGETKEVAVVSLDDTLYNSFLDNFEDESILSYSDEYPKWKKRWDRSDEFLNFLSSKEDIQGYISKKEEEVSVLEYRVCEVWLNNNGCYDIPNFIWVKTNRGIRIIEFRGIAPYEAEYYEGVEIFGGMYQMIYYNDPSKYSEKYKERKPEIYFNGVKKPMNFTLSRNNIPFISLRTFFEGLGAEVDWQEHRNIIRIKSLNKNLSIFLDEKQYTNFGYDNFKCNGMYVVDSKEEEETWNIYFENREAYEADENAEPIVIGDNVYHDSVYLLEDRVILAYYQLVDILELFEADLEISVNGDRIDVNTKVL